ncbi:MAG: sulfite exporter TauE/SafE family protein [Rhodospirillaceae bacterium]|nr:sulfite exporter TauE/SafE family protein [Rhodospirillaceae bacterium]
MPDFFAYPFSDLSTVELSVLCAVTLLAGAVRGFTGFGAAMIFVPPVSVLLSPAVGVLLLFFVDGFITMPMVVGAARRCRWGEVLPIVAGASLTAPFGAMVLASADPGLLAKALAVIVLLAVGLLASGWRYTRALPKMAVVGVGATAGFTGTLASLYGPPIVLFWLGGTADASTVRANLITFFGLSMVISGASFWLSDLFTWEVTIMGVWLIPVYGVALWFGAKGFGLASEKLYRYGALGVAGIMSAASLLF